MRQDLLVDTPETRYARTAVGKIAYQVFGDGAVPVLVHSRSWLPLDRMWEEPRMARFLERLSSFCRMLWFDPRGRGASDPVPHHEGRLAMSVLDDMVGVLDALGWGEVAILGLAGTHEVLLAATHPDRVRALVLTEPVIRYRRSPDYPQGWSDADVERGLADIEERWGTGANLEFYAPLDALDGRLVRWFAQCERSSMSPAEASWRYRAAWDVDLRRVLPSITVPTLVIDSDDRTSALTRYVVEHIPGCRRLGRAEPGHLFFTGDTAPTLDGIEEFLTGRLPTRDLSRVLSTVVFTDVVGSTERSTRLRDRRWLEVLADHNAIVSAEVERFRGEVVKTTGDGFVATFDSPGRAIRAAQAAVHATRSLGIEIRVGIHTGEIERIGDDIGGIVVNIAQRLENLAPPGGVVVSRIVKDLVSGSDIHFTEMGHRSLRGATGTWELFSADTSASGELE